MTEQEIKDFRATFDKMQSGELLGTLLSQGYTVVLTNTQFTRNRFYFNASRVESNSDEKRFSLSDDSIVDGLRSLAFCVALAEDGARRNRRRAEKANEPNPQLIAVAAEG